MQGVKVCEGKADYWAIVSGFTCGSANKRQPMENTINPAPMALGMLPLLPPMYATGNVAMTPAKSSAHSTVAHHSARV